MTVNWQNIQSSHQYNFDKYDEEVEYLGFPYDLNSIMHYDNFAFSLNGEPTIVAKNGVTLLPSYKKFMLSQIDKAEIKKRYNC